MGDDIQLLNRLLQQVKEQEEEDARSKQHQRAEALRFMEALREQMGQDAENEAELERMWQIENDKEWSKREAVWKKNQEARDNLLREVFEERSLQLELQRRNMQDQLSLQQEERERILQEMEALTLIDNERKEKSRQVALDTQAQLKEQIQEREWERMASRREVDAEKVASELADQAFRRKVQEQLDAVESTRPKAYAHVHRPRPY
eukprot:NODE_1869_length_1046_cov_48.641926_g1520_i0.p1 GENE.NODE_1869_length_1046_cov_48.641926_g1520_i0~~NODE_1869_length_1046_cov_48.641926_g1520_i0.p1  ORF type:complete len:228 (-),score=91.03 NODE_1869_length_1046_cov_48.641926_g1520_i0:362-979(-)